MNDKNFDSLKNLKTPDSWIENALNIPKAQAQEKKPIFFIRYSRQLVAVACLVLVCTVSLFVVLNKGDESVLVVDPNHSETQAEKNDASENGRGDSPDTTKTDKKENKKKKPQSIIQSILDNLNGGAPHESTEHSEKPTQSQDNDTQKPTQKPSVRPTKPSDGSVKPTDVPQSTTAPSEKPTTPSTQPPYQEPSSPMPPGDPQAPPPTESIPTKPGAPGSPAQGLVFSLVVSKHFLTSGEQILCAVMNPDGSPLIEDVPVNISPYGESAMAYISIYSNQLTQSGNHTCYFYSSSGYYIGECYSYGHP